MARKICKDLDIEYNWKERALEKQKKNRALEIKVRDLLASRDKWKERAKQAEEELLKLQKGEEQPAKKIISEKVGVNIKDDDLPKELKAKEHHSKKRIIFPFFSNPDN